MSTINDQNSKFIKAEIERFESVHPSIYSIYESINEIKDQSYLQTQIRDHLMLIEDSFVNSQEWTISRSVLDIRIALIGTFSSGKSSLVHRFLTGTFLRDDIPEGGRFKKEIRIENQSYLLLIRDEANPPDNQLTHWVDGIIFVFSLDNEESFKTIYQYYTKMSHYRNLSDVPIILVGTQDRISESNPPLIDEYRAQRLSNELKRCTYYQTCSTYGLNVDRVFSNICFKIVQQRYSLSRKDQYLSLEDRSPLRYLNNSQSVPLSSSNNETINLAQTAPSSYFSSPINENFIEPVQPQLEKTPIPKRKETKRRSNLFTPGKKDEEKKIDRIGHGRTIPIKQGYLYKKGTNSINREWKKKYLVLLDDGRIIYHPSFHDYENDVHGKEIILQRTTIKIPGGNKFRSSLKSSNNEGTTVESTFIVSNSSQNPNKTETTNNKKRHRRLPQVHLINSNSSLSTSKSLPNSSIGVEDDGNENVFIIISVDKQWIFEAQSTDERDEWIQAIEQQILSSLQNIETTKIDGQNLADLTLIQSIKSLPGNSICADCNQTNPTWASLNHGALICMDCASIHRNLGTHLSRVRSLELDEWPSDLVHVMKSIGNKLVNSILESNLKNRSKPQSNSSISERDRWIREKYEQKLFLPPLNLTSEQIGQRFLDAIRKEDLYTIILFLAHRKISMNDINRFLIHLAASEGNVTILQLLLWYGCDPFSLDNNGRTPLQCANGDCIKTLQKLTKNRLDIPQEIKSISSSGPLFDKIPSSFI